VSHIVDVRPVRATARSVQARSCYTVGLGLERAAGEDREVKRADEVEDPRCTRDRDSFSQQILTARSNINTTSYRRADVRRYVDNCSDDTSAR
jgi:hypothetical protein